MNEKTNDGFVDVPHSRFRIVTADCFGSGIRSVQAVLRPAVSDILDRLAKCAGLESSPVADLNTHTADTRRNFWRLYPGKPGSARQNCVLPSADGKAVYLHARSPGGMNDRVTVPNILGPFDDGSCTGRSPKLRKMWTEASSPMPFPFSRHGERSSHGGGPGRNPGDEGALLRRSSWATLLKSARTGARHTSNRCTGRSGNYHAAWTFPNTCCQRFTSPAEWERRYLVLARSKHIRIYPTLGFPQSTL